MAISITATPSVLVEEEGTEVTLTISSDEPIPEGGLELGISSELENALGQFDVFAAQFDSVQLVGVNDNTSGFRVRLNEQTGTITLPIFDDQDADSPLDLTFSVEPGEGYTVDENAGSVTLTIEDGESETTIPEPTPEPPTGELPVVSFEAIPSNVSEEAGDRIATLEWKVTGEIPEEGLVVNFDNLFGITDQLDGADDRAAANNLQFASFDRPNNRIGIRLLDNEASFVFPIINDIVEEGTSEFNFILAPGDGYTVDPEKNTTLFSITDDNGGPGVGPTVGLSVSETNLAEGDEFTVNFNLAGEIPADGVEVLVESSLAGALGLFDIANLENISVTGIDGLPRVGDTRGSSFIVNIVEPNASITLSVFDNIIAEELRESSFSLVNGELYEINPDAASVTLSISDEPQPVGPTVGITVDKSDVVEGELVTLTFNVEGDISPEGLSVLVNDTNSAENGLRSLSEFDIANLEFTGINGFPTPAEGDSGFFVNITEPTATITLPVFDEGADEDEATESFTFEVIDGEAYEVDADAGAVTLNISDAPEPGDDEPVDEAIFNFEWTGQIAEFMVKGQFSYDAAQSYEAGIVREEDLLSFDVSFFDPDGNLLRTYTDNQDLSRYPTFNFAFDTQTQEILQDGTWDVDDDINLERNGFMFGEGNPDLRGMEGVQSGLAFWTRPSDDKLPHLHVDDWDDELGFPIGYSSHEDVSFPTLTVADLIDNGKVGETYLESVQDSLDELGKPVVVSVSKNGSEGFMPLFGTVEGDVIEVEGSNQLIFAGAEGDLVDASVGSGSGNRLYLGGGDDIAILGMSDRIVGGAGDDKFFAMSGGDNVITGGAGADQFWIATAEIPDAANIITDFTSGEDVLGIAGLGIGFDDLSITQQDDNTLIAANNSELAILQGVGADILNADNFAFV